MVFRHKEEPRLSHPKIKEATSIDRIQIKGSDKKKLPKTRSRQERTKKKKCMKGTMDMNKD
jgi:hypothetical protein